MLSKNKVFNDANKISLKEQAIREELKILIEINNLKAKLLVSAKMDYSTQIVYSKNGTKLGKFCEFYSK